MSEWRRRWVITLRWDERGNSPYGQDQRVFTVSARELGEMIRAARADPHIIAFPYQARWHRVGAEPDTCPAGHPLRGGSFTRSRLDWWTCEGCHGHFVHGCRLCPAEVLDPPLGPYCRPRPPAAGQPTQHP